MGVIFDPLLGELRTTDQNLFDARYVKKSGDTMTGELDIQMDYATAKTINTNASQYAGAKFLSINNFSAMGNQGGGWFVVGISDTSHSQGYMALERADYQGNYVSTLQKFDYNAGTAEIFVPLQLDGNLTFTSLNGALFNNSSHMLPNSSTRTDLGFYSNAGAGFEIYSYSDSSRPGQFRTIYGGAVGQGFVQFIQYDGTNFNSVLLLNAAGQLQLPISGNTGGILLGGDANLYRESAGVVATDNTFKLKGGAQLSFENTSFNSSATIKNVGGSGASILELSAQPKFSGTNTTGAGSAALGGNSPATTNTAPYTWIKAVSSDGSTVYIPCWK